jgi:hypothetical protein
MIQSCFVEPGVADFRLKASVRLLLLVDWRRKSWKDPHVTSLHDMVVHVIVIAAFRTIFADVRSGTSVDAPVQDHRIQSAEGFPALQAAVVVDGRHFQTSGEDRLRKRAMLGERVGIREVAGADRAFDVGGVHVVLSIFRSLESDAAPLTVMLREHMFASSTLLMIFRECNFAIFTSW